MPTMKLGQFGDLTVEDADFCLRRLTPETILDLAGVQQVAPGFLEALTQGWSAEEIARRTVNATGQAADALAALIAARRPDAPAEAPTDAPPPAGAAPEARSDRYTPGRLVRRLRRQLRDYIESAYPLADPALLQARRHLLDTAQEGHLLAQEPYIETTPRYATFNGTYNDLGLEPQLASFLDQLTRTPQQHDPGRTILYPHMYLHQQQAFTHALAHGKDVIVATGTGSGKTECFLVPMLGGLYREASQRPTSFARPGVRALILYPMNALVNDQTSRLRLLFGDEGVAGLFRAAGGRHPRFGMYTGRTLYPGPRSDSRDNERVVPVMDYYAGLPAPIRRELQRLGRYPAKDLSAFYARHLEDPTAKGAARLNWKRRLHTHPDDRELLIRQEMVNGAGSDPGHAPDILVTNYSMLEYMLMRPFERPIFAETREWLAEGNRLLLVLDEAHMYRGAKGAEVGFLLRRLCARLGIHEHPERLQVICTSASLGSGREALRNITRFAADLTGKPPDSFVPVVGVRATPEHTAPGSDPFADVLAAVDPDTLHALRTSASDLERLRDQLRPIFAHLGHPPPGEGEAALLEALFRALHAHATINLLLKETAQSARSLPDLAARLFPGHPQAHRATEVLLALGTLARARDAESGLIPARVHAMFRGLQALYACINAGCPAAAPGAILGPLFDSFKPWCPHCSSRVFELASCRNCGSPYLLAFVPGPTSSWLWPETEGDLERLQLLPLPPRYPGATREISVHLRSGSIDPAYLSGPGQRRLWIPLDEDGEPACTFSRCPLCQPRGRARISDFRTYGEPPFTALLSTQFIEQPPQKDDPRLPNRGRKVLVFSDGRQKAARLAPALEYNHARDSFRQVIALAIQAMDKDQVTGLQHLYPMLLHICIERGIPRFPGPIPLVRPEDLEIDDRLFSTSLQTARQNAGDAAGIVELARQNLIQPTLGFAHALFTELTERFHSIQALGLATVEENPKLWSGVARRFPEVGLSPEQIQILYRCWLRLQLESRRFLPAGGAAQNIGEGWERPDGIEPMKPGQLTPLAFSRWLRTGLSEEQAGRVERWLEDVLRSPLCCTFNNRYYLSQIGLHLRLRVDADWLCCQDCSRLFFASLWGRCPACCGHLQPTTPDYLEARTGFYRNSLRRALSPGAAEPFGLTAEEHTAQLTGSDDGSAFSRVEQYELRFQDLLLDGQPPVDILSCTTTMEVGIDIGALSGVALRNVPPHVANYQQRAGRAGRRGRSIASVMTYAHGSSHDAWFFQDPGAIISGPVLPPIVYIENQQVLLRHLHAFLVQRFFHETVTPRRREMYMLFESMGTVEDFISERHACSLSHFDAWISRHRADLIEEMVAWVPTHSFGLSQDIPGTADTVRRAVDGIAPLLRQTLRQADFNDREALPEAERQGLDRLMEEQLLEALINRAVFPRYAFPTDVVNFWVHSLSPPSPSGHRRFDYEPQRDLQLALSEYAPGSSLTIDKYRFTSAALYNPYGPSIPHLLQRARPYVSCATCAYVSVEDDALTRTACPCCGSTTLNRQRFVRPNGFAPDINATRVRDTGAATLTAGRASRAQLEVQQDAQWSTVRCDGRLRLVARPDNLVTVNKGVQDSRLYNGKKGGRDEGFYICPECGRAEPASPPPQLQARLVRKGKPIRHLHPTERGVECNGRAEGPFFLGHRFRTDILLLELQAAPPMIFPSSSASIEGQAARNGALSLVEAICLAASRELQIDEGELAGNWCPVYGGPEDRTQIFLYDLLPGGAGYARMVEQNLEKVLLAARGLLSGCTCALSCYQCLRHYANRFIHPFLDRHLALAILDHVLTGTVPTLDPSAVQVGTAVLEEVIHLRGGKTAPAPGGLTLYTPEGTPTTIRFHHPFVRPSGPEHPVNLYTVHHNLPEVIRTLGWDTRSLA